MWVNNQRKRLLHDHGELMAKRKELLNAIDFEWDPHDTRWNELFERLVEYKKKNGSTMVPSKYKQDPELAGWVKRQREKYKAKQILLSKDKIEKLDSIGFVWSAR
jgi:hypothetical protein